MQPSLVEAVLSARVLQKENLPVHDLPFIIKCEDIFFTDDNGRPYVLSDPVFRNLEAVRRAGNWPEEYPNGAQIKAELTLSLARARFQWGEMADKHPNHDMYLYFNSKEKSEAIRETDLQYAAAGKPPVYFLMIPLSKDPGAFV
jgi:hypothetical protein